MTATDRWIEVKAMWAEELKLRRRLKQTATPAEEEAIIEGLANLPIGPDAQDHLDTESAQEILQSSRLRWEKELVASSSRGREAAGRKSSCNGQ